MIEKIYLLLLCGIAGVYMYFIHAAYSLNKKWFAAIIILPASIFIFSWLHWRKTMMAWLHLGILLFMVFGLQFIEGLAYLPKTFNLISEVLLWPIYAIKALI